MEKKAKGLLADVTGKNVNIEPESHYDNWASSYDSDLLNEYGYCAHRIAVNALAQLEQDTSISVLDVGCGTGLVGIELKKAGFLSVDGHDISSRMLQQAAKLNLYRQLVHIDAENNNNQIARKYDAVLSVGTFGIGHMGPKAMSKVAAHAKDGGLVVLFMNAEPFVDLDFHSEINQMQSAGSWSVLTIEDHNYMDALERPGKLIVARAQS